MVEANHDSEFRKGDTVRHSEYGKGEVTRLYDLNEHSIRVEFDSVPDFVNVSPKELKLVKRKLLHDTSVEVDEERTDEDGLTHGEERIDHDFEEGVDYDVDTTPDGTIIVQYWREQEKSKLEQALDKVRDYNDVERVEVYDDKRHVRVQMTHDTGIGSHFAKEMFKVGYAVQRTFTDSVTFARFEDGNFTQ